MSMPTERPSDSPSSGFILDTFKWMGGSLMLAVLGSILYDYLVKPIFASLLNSTQYNTSPLNQINFSWLPPPFIMILALILGYLAHFYVQRAQNIADNRIVEAKREIAEWAEICECLVDSLAFDVNEWEETRKLPKKGSTTKSTQKRWDERNYYYKKLSQKLKEYDGTNKSEKPREQIQSPLENIDRVPPSDELEKLIKPLYLSLDSNRDNPLKGADLAFEDIKRYGNCAQPGLRKLLKQYCDIREEWENTKQEDRAPTFHWNHQTKLRDTVNQIYILTKQRYEELMWGEEKS